jgi:hypothetical protein
VPERIFLQERRYHKATAPVKGIDGFSSSGSSPEEPLEPLRAADNSPTTMRPWSTLGEGSVTIRGRSGTGGKEPGPVLQEAQGAVVFIGGGNEKEAFAVWADIVADHACPIDSKRGTEREQ